MVASMPQRIFVAAVAVAVGTVVVASVRLPAAYVWLPAAVLLLAELDAAFPSDAVRHVAAVAAFAPGVDLLVMFDAAGLSCTEMTGGWAPRALDLASPLAALDVAAFAVERPAVSVRWCMKVFGNVRMEQGVGLVHGFFVSIGKSYEKLVEGKWAVDVANLQLATESLIVAARAFAPQLPKEQDLHGLEPTVVPDVAAVAGQID